MAETDSAKETELMAALVDLAEYLDHYGEDRWASHFRACAEQLQRLARLGAPPADRRIVLTTIRSVYAGRGGFGDLVLHPANGHPVEFNQIAEANQGLEARAQRVHDLSV
jgi:hypothetical protein